MGIIAPHGRLLAIEIKTGQARQSAEQKSFQIMVEKKGGLYIVARSLQDVNILL